jgi:nitrite reductase (NADH) large subunit
VRARFRSFVNSEQPDEHIAFVEERGQIRPASPDERRQRVIPVASA